MIRTWLGYWVEEFVGPFLGQIGIYLLIAWCVTISDLAIFNFLFTIRRGFRGVTYVADTCLLTIRPGGSHMTPPVLC